MSALAGIYCEDIRKNFKTLYAAWPPNEPLRLGDFGVLKDDVILQRLGNIEDAFAISFKQRKNPDRVSNFDYASSDSTTIEFHAKGDGTPGGAPIKAGLDISFSSKHAVFFNAAKCIPTSIEDQYTLADKIMELYDAGKWHKEFVLVTGLMDAGATTVIISGSSNSSISLEASSDKVANIDLADVSIKLGITKAKDIAFKVVTEKSLTPLVGLSKIHGGILEDDHFGPAAVSRAAAQVRGKTTQDLSRRGYREVFFGRLR